MKRVNLSEFNQIKKRGGKGFKEGTWSTGSNFYLDLSCISFVRQLAQESL